MMFGRTLPLPYSLVQLAKYMFICKVPLLIFTSCNVSPVHQASGTDCNIRSVYTPFDFSFLADGLLSHMITQQTLSIAIVSVTGNFDIDNARHLLLVVRTFVLTQHDYLLTQTDSMLRFRMSVMTRVQGIWSLCIFVLFLSVLHISVIHVYNFFHTMCIFCICRSCDIGVVSNLTGVCQCN
jgi:hypothetical protein